MRIPTSIPKVLIRCDASPEIGGGHVVRCMALAEAFQLAGASVRFCVSDRTLSTVRELDANFPDSVPGFDTDPSAAVRLGKVFGATVDVLVIDHYGICDAYENAARAFTRQLVVIDDCPNRRHASTHLVDTTLGRKSEEYSAFVPADARVLAGSAYAMIRRPFSRRRASSVMPGSGNVSSILVTFGMTDFAGLSLLAADALRSLPARIAVTFVIGSSAPSLPSLRTAVASSGRNWRLCVDADAERMAELTSLADIVIGSPGSASYERCCLGKPTLLIQGADNQASNAIALVNAGAARLVGAMPGLTAGDLLREVTSLLPSDVKLMTEAAWSVTDGQGADRIVEELLTTGGLGPVSTNVTND